MIEKLKKWLGEATTKAGLAGLLYAAAAWIGTGSWNAELFPGAPTAKSALIAAVMALALKGRDLGPKAPAEKQPNS